MRRIFFSFVWLLLPFMAMGQQYIVTGAGVGGRYLIEVSGTGTTAQYNGLKKDSPAIAEEYLLSMLDEDFTLAIKDYCERILTDDAVASEMLQLRQGVEKRLLDEILKYQGQGIVGQYDKSGDKSTSVVKIAISSKESIASLFVEKMQEAIGTSGDGSLQTDFVGHIFARVVDKTLAQSEHQIKTVVKR